MKCTVCGYDMTLLLHTYVCDWCDGIVEDEWDKEEVTESCGEESNHYVDALMYAYNGQMTDFRFWSTIRTAEEIIRYNLDMYNVQ